MMSKPNSALAANKFKKAFAKDPHISRLVIMLIAVFVFFAIVKTGNFLRPIAFQSMGYQFPEFGIMALGVMLTMITGGIDLSVVGVANVTGISCALLMVNMTKGDVIGPTAGAAILCAFLLGIAVGTVCGLLNGFLVSKIKIPPILATLGTFELFSGIAVVLTGGNPVNGLPPAYSQTFASLAFGAIPMPLIIFAVVVIIVAMILNKTTFGLKIYMLGTNAVAAKFSGLKITQLLLKTYMLSGILAAVSGLVMLANYNSAKADYGNTYTLQTILIVVLGGVNPSGGRGKVLGVVLAIAVLQMLSSGLNMFPAISNFYRYLIWGTVLLIIIIADYLKPFTKKQR